MNFTIPSPKQLGSLGFLPRAEFVLQLNSIFYAPTSECMHFPVLLKHV